ncbi:hypothetical protein COBT_002233 [Conglomerata obtusa]
MKTDLNSIEELKYLIIALKLLKETDEDYIIANHAEAHNKAYVICLLKAKIHFKSFFCDYFEQLKLERFYFKSSIHLLQSDLKNIIAENKLKILPEFFSNWLEAMIDCLGYPYCLAFINQKEEERSTKIALKHFVDFFIESFRYDKMKCNFDNVCNKDSFVQKYKDLVLYKINSVSLRNIINKVPASNLQESKQENSEQEERDEKCLPASYSNISMGNSIKDTKEAYKDNIVHPNPSKTIFKDKKNINDMNESEINDYLDIINSELDILRDEICNLQGTKFDLSKIENLKEILQQALKLVNNAFEERIVLKKLVEENMIRRDITRKTLVNKKKSGFKIEDVKINSMKETSSDRVCLKHLVKILEKLPEQGKSKCNEKNEIIHIEGERNKITYDHSQHFNFNFNSR